MRFLSNPKQLRFIISRNGDTAKTVLKTSYDIVSLPYLLSYVMGIFFEEYELQANVIDDAHDLGFVEGVRYALNIMDMTDTGKNKELLERLLNILEREVGVNGKKG